MGPDGYPLRVDRRRVDRISQQRNKVSANQLLDVLCQLQLQLHQAGELAVSTDGLWAH